MYKFQEIGANNSFDGIENEGIDYNRNNVPHENLYRKELCCYTYTIK